MSEVPLGTHEWHDQTTLHPLGLTVVLICGAVLFTIPRRYATLPILIVACFVAPAQRLVIFGLDFNLLRVMVLFGGLRVFALQEHRGLRWHPIDTLMLAWAVTQTALYTIQQGSTDALVNRLGASFDAVGMYFLFRVIVRSWDDIAQVARMAVLLSVPVVAAFIVENRTQRNMFAFLGGVPEFTVIRDGRLRVQGAFAHPILAGTFWAALLPSIAALWWRGGRDRTYAFFGVFNCLLCVVLCASSTPVAAVALGLFGALMWFARHWMSSVRLAAAAMLVFLHFAMEAPVWHLLSRIDLVGGSTGWHRYKLFDAFVNHFSEWALVGTPTTYHWAWWGLTDITNQYVMEGVRGGLVSVVLFVAIIAVGFRAVGELWRREYASPWRSALAWSLGVALWVHATAFFAVSYFGQIIVIWYMLLAMIASMASSSDRSFRPDAQSSAVP